MAKVINKQKYCIQFDTKLSSVFRDEPSLAWEMVDQQCNIYTNPNVDVEYINKLSSIYCRIVQKLNLLQDSRQKYFNNKMQKLMAQPFIIRCYTDYAQNKESDTNLKQKRKDLEQKLSIQAEKQNSQAFIHILNTQNQKQKKLKEKIDEVLVQHEKSLENRLQLRSLRRQMSSPKKKNSEGSLLNGSQLVNPQGNKPAIIRSKDQCIMLDLTSTNNNKYDLNDAARTKSQRILSYHFNMDSSDSEDEYRIQKLIRQSNINAATEKTITQQDQEGHRKNDWV